MKNEKQTPTRIRLTREMCDKLAERTRFKSENELIEIVAAGRISAIDLTSPETMEENANQAIWEEYGDRAGWATDKQVKKVAKLASEKIWFWIKWNNGCTTFRQTSSSKRISKIYEAFAKNKKRVWDYEQDRMFVGLGGDPRAYGSYPRH